MAGLGPATHDFADASKEGRKWPAMTRESAPRAVGITLKQDQAVDEIPLTIPHSNWSGLGAKLV
jgi:hypothetical protein